MAIVLNGSTGITTPSIDSSGGDIAATSLSVAGSNISAANSVGFRNRIINGAMVIDQRNAGASVSETGAGQYTLDRWQVAGASPGVFSVTRSTTAPSGYINSLLITVTTADASLSGASYQLQQKVEGLNCSDLGWGSANAKTVTLSFVVRSSITGTFGGVFTNNGYDWTYPFSYTINSANTWETKSVTIEGPTSGTWLTTNGTGIQLVFGLGAQVARKATAGVWANTVARQPTGSVDLIATNGATFYLTGVQLEVGSVATEFERRPYGTELALCQRYCEVVRKNASETLIGNGFNYTNQYVFMNYSFKVTKRVEPTGTLTGSVGDLEVLETNSGWYDMTSASFQSNLNAVRFNMNSAPTSKTAGQSNEVRIEAASSTKIVFDAEL